MTYIFNVEGKERYQLIKRDPGWEMKKYDDGGRIIEAGPHKGKETVSGWKAMNQGNGCYPHSIRHAMDLMMDDIILTHGRGRIPILDGLADIKRILKAIEATKDAKTDELLAVNQF